VAQALTEISATFVAACFFLTAFRVFSLLKAVDMQSSAAKLEQRVNVLERQLRQIKSELKIVKSASKRPWWRQLAGRFKNDPLFDQIAQAGKTYRRSLTPRAR